MKKFKEVGLQEKVRLVLTRIEGSFNEDDVQSILNAMNYAGKKDLRLPKNVSIELTSEPQVFGNTVILDLYIPLGSSFSSNVYDREAEFLNSLSDYFQNGIYHKTADEWFGDFGKVSFTFVSPNPTREVTVTFETDESSESIIETLQKDLNAKNIQVI